MTLGMRTILSAGLFLAISCSRVAFVPVAGTPDIFPDYNGVTVPEGLAPLSFAMADGREVSWISERIGDTLYYRVRAWKKGRGRGRNTNPSRCSFPRI